MENFFHKKERQNFVDNNLLLLYNNKKYKSIDEDRLFNVDCLEIKPLAERFISYKKLFTSEPFAEQPWFIKRHRVIYVIR